MAIGREVLDFYVTLAKEKILHSGQSICELGAQELGDTAGYDTSALCTIFNRQSIPLTGSSLDFMSTLGFVNYTSIDMSAQWGALRFDLNTVKHPHLGYKTFDVVTNLGTIEHVFNTANCFQLMHELTAVGGVMLHVGPVGSRQPGWDEHGFYLLSHNLFRDLARANKYDVLCQYSVEHRDGSLFFAALKRTNSGAFVTPIQTGLGYSGYFE